MAEDGEEELGQGVNEGAGGVFGGGLTHFYKFLVGDLCWGWNLGVGVEWIGGYIKGQIDSGVDVLLVLGVLWWCV